MDNPFVLADLHPPKWAATNCTTGRVEGRVKDQKHTQVGGRTVERLELILLYDMPANMTGHIHSADVLM
jgi:hypothetical protein